MMTEPSSSDDHSTPANQGAQSIHADDSAGIRRRVHAIGARVRRARESVQRASNGTTSYIKSEPRKAMFIAFALGAALAAVVSLFVRSRGED
jgi:ElaB/YqjD/DUF883 family membrane-anchored ribosome-binding protein